MLIDAAPELVKEWDYEQNVGINITDVTTGSGKKVWWKCNEGHSWEAFIYSRVNGNSCPYCSGLYPIPGVNDLATTNPELVAEWDGEKNTEKITECKSGSQKKVYWKCIEGHSWEATIASRALLGTKCPYCSGKKAISGINDLTTTNPELVSEWDYEKNKIDIKTVMKGTAKKAWWLCKEGHSWEASISSRANLKSGCPYCTNQKVLIGQNDLETLFPEIAAEWDVEKNNGVKANEVFSKSGKKAWWICKNGHSYNSVISSRTSATHTGCPYCAGQQVLTGFNDLKTRYPELANEWNYKKNNGFTPENITAHNCKKVWWICPKGHEYEAAIFNRVEGDNCPICSNRVCETGYNDLQTKNPNLCEEWDYEKNGELTPNHIVAGSSLKVWWLCQYCGHSWKAPIINRNNGVGCPKCNERSKTSFPEQAILYYVRKLFPDAINSYKDIFNNPHMEIDIYIPSLRLGIEYDGIAWHSSEATQEREQIKYNICKENHITLIRIKENRFSQNDKTCDFLIGIQMDYGTTVFQNIFEKLFSYLGVMPDINIERDQNIIKEQYYTHLKERSVGYLYPDLLEEWNTIKNGRLSLYMFLPGSQEKVWWKCKKCNFEWYTSISTRTKLGSGCPECSRISLGERIVKSRTKDGENTIAKKAKWLSQEWDYEKNIPMTPENTPPQSGKKVWWKCKEGHSWEEGIQYRYTHKLECPYCSGRWIIKGKNDFPTLFPEIAKQWNFEKNESVDIYSIKAGSNKEVWWKCQNCGNEWKEKIFLKVKKKKLCPYCS